MYIYNIYKKVKKSMKGNEVVKDYFKKVDVSFLLNNKAIENKTSFEELFDRISASLAYKDACFSLNKMKGNTSSSVEDVEAYQSCISTFYDMYQTSIDVDNTMKGIENIPLYRFIAYLIWSMSNLKAINVRLAKQVFDICLKVDLLKKDYKKDMTACKGAIIELIGNIAVNDDVMKPWNYRISDEVMLNMIMTAQHYNIVVKDGKGFTEKKKGMQDYKQALLNVFASTYGFIELKKQEVIDI